MKEFLVKNQNDEYVLINDVSKVASKFVIEIPEDAESFNFLGDKSNTFFLKKYNDEYLYSNECSIGSWDGWHDWGDEDFDGVICLWQRDPVEGKKEDNVKHSHYFIDVSDVDSIDFYEIAKRYNVEDPAIQHILKKCLAVGNRGHKDLERDLRDIHDTSKRALEINKFTV